MWQSVRARHSGNTLPGFVVYWVSTIPTPLCACTSRGGLIHMLSWAGGRSPGGGSTTFRSCKLMRLLTSSMPAAARHSVVARTRTIAPLAPVLVLARHRRVGRVALLKSSAVLLGQRRGDRCWVDVRPVLGGKRKRLNVWYCAHADQIGLSLTQGRVIIFLSSLALLGQAEGAGRDQWSPKTESQLRPVVMAAPSGHLPHQEPCMPKCASNTHLTTASAPRRRR